MIDNSPRISGAFRFSSRLERKIVRRVGQAIGDFGLIQEGDHLLVAVSGGKDSLSMLDILHLMRRRSPISFRITAVTVHQGEATFSTEKLEAHYQMHGYAFQVIHVPIKQILAEKLAPGTIPCSLCSRIRRGALYTLALELGCTKIALGHHLDDLLETLLMNLFFEGQLRSMAPLLHSDDGRNWIIRPLCYIPEAWLCEYSKQKNFPVTSCATLGCGEPDSSRKQMKRLLSDLEKKSPLVKWHMLRALQNIRPEHLLDRELIRRIENFCSAKRG